MKQLEDLAIRDRLPYEALVKLPPERLAATVVFAWDEVDAQQALLDKVHEETDRTGISYEIIHETNRFRVLLNGPFDQIKRMAKQATKVARGYAKLLTNASGVNCEVTGLHPPHDPRDNPPEAE